MLRNLIIGIGTIALVVGCKSDCKNTCPEEPEAISLAETSPQLQALIKSENAHIRGIKGGSPLSAVANIEDDKDLADKTGFYVNFNPDLTEDYWADIEYHFDDENMVEKIDAEIIPAGLTKEDNSLLVDSLFFELREYLSGKYGDFVTNTDYKLIWNDVNEIDKSITIFSLDYEIPAEDFTITPNDETGIPDTTENSPSVRYVVKYIQ